VGIILAWRIAGYIGADYFLLPWIGTPWSHQPDPCAEKVAEVEERYRERGLASAD
jgi:hypothetical protein